MDNVFKLGIIKIKELAYEIEDIEHLDLKNLNLNFDLNFNIISELNCADLTLSFSAIHNNINKRLIYIKVLNKFNLENVEQFRVDESKFNIPDEALITMLSISISHTRALLSKNLSNTRFEIFNIPIVDPTEMAKHFFKPMEIKNN